MRRPGIVGRHFALSPNDAKSAFLMYLLSKTPYSSDPWPGPFICRQPRARRRGRIDLAITYCTDQYCRRYIVGTARQRRN